VTGQQARHPDEAEKESRAAPLTLETSLPGVFAAGGEGAMAVRLVHEHLAATR
jgi:thioredoxin reductase (NADPH)